MIIINGNGSAIVFMFIYAVSLLVYGHGFVGIDHTSKNRHRTPRLGVLSGVKQMALSASSNQDDYRSHVEVVLFGLGDLRVHDHEGLANALENVLRDKERKRLLPLFILDTKCLLNFPGSVTSVYDTSSMISSALESLNEQLENLNVGPLNVIIGSTSDSLEKSLYNMECDSATVHVCDLGAADNSIGYNAYSQLDSLQTSRHRFKLDVLRWQCKLRNEPWSDCIDKKSNFPTLYPDFVDKYCGVNQKLLKPISVPNKISIEEKEIIISIQNNNGVPTSEEVAQMLGSSIYGKNIPTNALELERSTGLFGTHWGGVNNSLCNEKEILDSLKTYSEFQCDDNKLLSSGWYEDKFNANAKSLEHASISWMSAKGHESRNLLRGELMIRYLTAPLLLGCISARQIWHSTASNKGSFNSFQQSDPLKDMAEAHEWHKILAAHNIYKSGESTHVCSKLEKAGEMKYGYWRWQGFLCRYAVSSLISDITLDKSDKTALLFIHGFGASGSQWQKKITEVAKCALSLNNVGGPTIALAPDLIGFGQSEKPALTYTQYLWESYVSDFQKQIGQNKYKTGKYVIGGNSIGGYTSMACAADDSIPVCDNYVSANGSVGSNKCIGLFLMNSAGQINAKNVELDSKTVAEMTYDGGLPPCSPPPRPIATVLGQGLLWYLRPRISSICKNLYPTNQSAVNDDLCSNILRDSLDPGAINIMISGSKLPRPRTANDLLYGEFGTLIRKDSEVYQGSWSGPSVVIQGMLDPLQDSNERVAGFTGLRKGIDKRLINAGHCPHDELPLDSANALYDWLRTVLTVTKEVVNA